ncbi:5'-methylthioadenosine/adenosylhomocysteine nucleosidase [Bacillus daqingensis]|uniref:adenosylhomocysteine nucleosidase n=1 Tax=Bacillus daqingensis TaxID=872396 RepID=A0ABV9NXX3_9BACI
MKIGLIGAMEEEIAHFMHLLTVEEKYQLAKNTYAVGKFGMCDVVLTKAGVGKVNAAAAAQKMIDVFEVDVLLFTGVAGAANPDYEIGDVVISTSCQQHDIEAEALGFPRGTIPMSDTPADIPADESWQQRLLEAANELEDDVNVYAGKVVSGDQFIADKDKVADLRQTFQADCVEMEGAAVAQIAWMHDVPFVILRSMSDKANGEAPEAFQKWVYETAERSAAIISSALTRLSSEISSSQ